MNSLNEKKNIQSDQREKITKQIISDDVDKTKNQVTMLQMIYQK